MTITLAMAGLAEAALGTARMVCLGLLALAAIAAVIVWIGRARVWAGIAIFLFVVVSVLFAPWMGFVPMEISDDPDEHYWAEKYRETANLWALVGCMVGFATFWAWKAPSISTKTTPCGKCGRENAVTTTICPHCMTRDGG